MLHRPHRLMNSGPLNLRVLVGLQSDLNVKCAVFDATPSNLKVGNAKPSGLEVSWSPPSIAYTSDMRFSLSPPGLGVSIP